MHSKAQNPRPWWQTAVFYQIYPRSFADGNGDGIGDLAGMIDHLDDLQDLGVDAIWLSPHYPSPMFDCGYDVSNYTSVAAEYGTLDDFRRFLDGVHQRGMYLILDLVLNHTSHQHPWFVESRASKSNPRRDWYVWQAGKNGAPPNNWLSSFGGSAWELDPTTGEYYYHFFFKEQPDLNWRNPAVKQAMFKAVRFWLDMGVDGFRLDAISTLYEDPDLKDNPSPYSQADLYRLGRQAKTDQDQERIIKVFRSMLKHQYDQPGIHELMRELRELCDSYGERVLVGETEEISYYGDGTDELHLVFNFPLMETRRLTPTWVIKNQRERLATLPSAAWPCNTLGNHDSPRVYSRFADGQHDDQIARLSLALLLTLRGTPFLYNGEEIGMRDYIFQDLARFKDRLSLWAYQMEREVMDASHEQAIAQAAEYGRDKCRTPLQWTNAPNAGFCPQEVKPWLPVNPDFSEGVNIEEQRRDPGSIWHFYRRMLHLRKRLPALMHGDFTLVSNTPNGETQSDILAFLRQSTHPQQTCLVVMNFSEKNCENPIQGLAKLAPEFKTSQASVIFTNTQHREDKLDLTELALAPFEILIVELQAV
jgi:alpha-glucosidase